MSNESSPYRWTKFLKALCGEGGESLSPATQAIATNTLNVLPTAAKILAEHARSSQKSKESASDSQKQLSRRAI